MANWRAGTSEAQSPGPNWAAGRLLGPLPKPFATTGYRRTPPVSRRGLHWGLLAFASVFGGGAGNRTRVRTCSDGASTCVGCLCGSHATDRGQPPRPLRQSGGSRYREPDNSCSQPMCYDGSPITIGNDRVPNSVLRYLRSESGGVLDMIVGTCVFAGCSRGHPHRDTPHPSSDARRKPYRPHRSVLVNRARSRRTVLFIAGRSRLRSADTASPWRAPSMAWRHQGGRPSGARLSVLNRWTVEGSSRPKAGSSPGRDWRQGDPKLANEGHASPPPASLWRQHQREPGGWTQVEARQGMWTW